MDVLFVCGIGLGSAIICFVKQKTAYEMRISDWSSDVCSSDLHAEDDGDHDHAADQVQGVRNGGPEVRVGDEVVEVFQARERMIAGLHQVVGDEDRKSVV